MNLTKKIAKFLALIFLVSPLFSCQEGCVEAEQFDSISIAIESKPSNIYGTYDPVSGGQRIDWKDTNLRTNGKPITLRISGSWMSLGGINEGEDDKLTQLPLCTLCSKKEGINNCICRPNQNPEAEKDPSGEEYTSASDGSTLDCLNNATHQDDKERCSCTKQHGKSTDYGVYSFPLDLLNKDETVKIADEQNNCKYDRGIGAYVSLWGRRGVDTPIRSYHLYSEETVCPIKLDSNGECKNSEGQDFTKYIFRSANGNGFMKDDQDGNDDIDNNTANDIYHGKNELLKTIMYDRYYSDNYGQYNVEIFGGFGEGDNTGLIEFMVGLVENLLIGKENASGVREGGIIRYMYQAVVQDSGFAALLQVSLFLYIAIFGAAHLWGLGEMNKTEIGKRFLKIGLIMLFISPTSWTFYNTFVVGFFKDGMDSVIALFMTTDEYSSSYDSSNASRFRYIDLMIKNLMSEAVAKKIISLFFSDLFGLLYIPIIYALIFFFIATMLYVASIYIANLMKILFVLAIGPIFFIFSLFQQTFKYFSNWLSYLAGRSFEMIVLFIILYMFLTIIDNNFTEMLLYRVCTNKWGVGPIQVSILKAEVNRGIIEWCLFFFTIAGLIFIMMQVIEKVPEIAGALFALQIGGKASEGGFGTNDDPHNRGTYRDGLAGRIAGAAAAAGATGLGFAARNIGSPIASLDFKGLNAIGDATGINAAYNKLTGGGIAGATMNSALDKAMKASGGDEQKARAAFISEMRSQMDSSPAKMAALGINEKSMSSFLDKKLVAETLQAALKDAAKEMKNMPAGQIPIGEAAIAKHLSQVVSEWAKKNMTESSQQKISDLLKTDGIKSLMREHGTMSGSEAARALYGNKEAQDKFRADLAHRQFEQSQKGDRAWKNPITVGLGRMASNLGNYVAGSTYNNAKIEAKNFERALEKEGKPKYLQDYINPKSLQFLDRTLLGKSEISKMAQDAKLNTMRAHLANNPDKDVTNAKNKKEAEKHNQKNQYFRDELRKNIKEEAGYKPDRNKRTEALNNFDKKNDKTLLEKAAHLSQLNKNLGLGKEDAQTRLAKLLAQEAKEVATKAKEAKTPKDKKAMEDRLKNLKKGMLATEIDEGVLKKFRDQEEENEKNGYQYLGPRDRKTDKDIDKEINKQEEEIKSAALDYEKEKIEKLGEESLKISKEAAEAGDLEAAKKIAKEGGKELLEESPSILPKGVDKAMEDRLKNLKKGMLATEIDEGVLKKFRDQEEENEKNGYQYLEPRDRKIDKDIDKEINKQEEEIKSAALDYEKEKIEKLGEETLKSSKDAAEAGDLESAKNIAKEGGKELLKESPSILPKGVDFEDMFGKGFTDLLLSGMKDLGLKAGQIIPGMNPDNEKEIGASAAEINSMKMTENQMLGQIKMAKMDLQIKEIELQQLGTSGDPAKIAEIHKEISNLKKAIITHQSDHEKLEATIAQELKKSSG